MPLAQTVLCEALSEDIGSVRLTEVEVPEPGPGEVRIRLKACAVNFPDLLMIQGKYQFKPPLPFAPGGEAAGDVEAVGSGVEGFREGDAVVTGIRYGGFCERVNAPASAVRLKPERLSYAKAASYQTAYLTAYVALVRRGGLQPGETLLVHGATGGVGMAAVDLGKHLGATVIATGGRNDKLAVVKRRGADHVLNYTLADGRLGGFREAVKALTDGRGADVIYDPVGGDVFDESMRCINWDGRILTIGFTSGRWPQAPVNLILIKHIAVIGVRAGEYGRRNPEKGRANTEAIYRMAGSGEIDPYVCRGFPLEQAVDAMRLLENREVVGKTVVTMNGYSMQA
ncbi:MAG: NADPH:quinone oxidoreductase family protein [Gammaproteobacteria bacterium]|nr:NADPH:quinone oxidoreductase family protein [Gammaproteobacteria bacterium]MYK28663.1 NADPH:quinone oxidoreductase family protein [Gammaproteobacteria bacterium]